MLDPKRRTMSKPDFSSSLLLIVLPILLLQSCEIRQNEKEPEENSVNKEQISGYVQKGPFLIGTSIRLSELNSGLVQTGKVFTTSIGSNQGEFEINNIGLISSYVELNADGFYFNELKGVNSGARLSLSAISDIGDKNTLNVNVLSHLEKDRLLKLVAEGASFGEAKRQSQEEVLKVFLIEKEDMAESELLDIAGEGEDNAVLLAVSVILQGHLTVADMSELIGKLNADLREDGKLDDPSIGTSLINNAKLADLAAVRSNLETRYKEMGLEVTLPDFEKYVEYFIDSCGYGFDLYPEYPETSNYGKNVLYLERDTFYTTEELSLAALLPEGSSLKIVLSGGMWYYRAMPQGPVNWNISIYDYGRMQQEFTATSPGEASDVNIMFEVPQGGEHSFHLEYLENGLTDPARVRDILVRDGNSPAQDEVAYPDTGQYGLNILAMETWDTLLQTGMKYSLAADFPGNEGTNISFTLRFSETGMFSVDPEEVNLWTIRQDTSYLEISASGKDIHPDMSIIFNKPGSLNLSGRFMNVVRQQ